jgi:hypothetical protein
MAVNRTIVLQGNSYGHHDEGVLDTACYPGMHIQIASDGKFDPSPQTAAELVKKKVAIAKEDAYQGKTVNDQYAIADRVFYYEPVPGDIIHCLVKSGETIAIGSQIALEGGGSGLFIVAAGTEAQYRFEAREAAGLLAANTLVRCVFNG